MEELKIKALNFITIFITEIDEILYYHFLYTIFESIVNSTIVTTITDKVKPIDIIPILWIIPFIKA